MGYKDHSRSAWWIRTALTFFVIPLIVVSCTTLPEAKTNVESDQIQSDPPLHPLASYHFIRGYLHELGNHYAPAIEEYQAGLHYDPNSVFLQVQIAKLYFSSGKMSAALEMIDQIPESKIEEVQTLRQMAKIYEGVGQPEKALTLYDRAISQEPQQAISYFSKGVLLLSLKRFEDAKPVFEMAIEQAQESPAGYYYLGVIAAESDQPEQAREHFEWAITLKKNYERAYQALATLYERQEDFEKALKVYERYLHRVNPSKREFRRQLVRLHLRQESFTKALEELDTILEDDPTDMTAKVHVALIHGQMGDHTEAIDQLTSILQAHPSELRVRDYLGLMYEERKDYENAILAYEANLEIEPSFYDSRLHLGFLAYRLKRYDEAIPHLDKAVDLHPERPESHLLLGLTYLAMEQYRLATSTFELGIEHHPTFPDLHFNLGAAYDKLHQFEDVVKEMEKVLSLDADHADALNYLGYTYADRGINIEEALRLTKRAVSLKPNNGYYVDSLGWALFKMGRVEEALVEIQRALELVKDDPIIFEHLGEIYLSQQNHDKAKEAWIRSIQLDPTNLKLINRFQEQGFGDPLQDDGVQQPQRRVSNHTRE